MFYPSPTPSYFKRRLPRFFQLVIFRFRKRLGRDCVSSGSWLQPNTNPGQYCSILCEQELVSYLGLTLTRVYELSMWQFTSWSKPLAHWFRSQIPTLTLHCLKCRNLLSLMIICSSVSAVTGLVKSHLQDPNVKFYLCKLSHLLVFLYGFSILNNTLRVVYLLWTAFFPTDITPPKKMLDKPNATLFEVSY